jgi:uncharacterized membrane protein (DUF106 family)
MMYSHMAPMQNIVFCTLLGFLWVARRVNAHGAWQNAHATFYTEGTTGTFTHTEIRPL